MGSGGEIAEAIEALADMIDAVLSSLVSRGREDLRAAVAQLNARLDESSPRNAILAALCERLESALQGHAD